MKILKWLDVNFEPICMSITFYMMVILISVQVVLRFFFGTGFAWGEEIVRFIFVWCMFLAAPNISRNNRHVGVGVFRSLLPENGRKWIMVLMDVLTLALIVVLLKSAVGNVMLTNEFRDRATSVNISMNWLFMAPVAGYVIMALRTLQTLIWKLRRLGCSFELFLNNGGYYSGADNVAFIPRKTREDLIKSHDPQAEEEEAGFSRRKGRC